MMMVGFKTILSSTSGLLVVAAFFSFASLNEAEAQRYASKERSNVAVGHYARARTMMVEALKEFEQGRRLARPDLLVDSEDFRLRLISLTEQLNRVVDPQPRVTRQGAIFRASPRLIRRQSDALPAVPGGAQDSNIYGEAQRLKELEMARARMYESVPAPVSPPAPAATETVEEQAPEEEVVVQVEDSNVAESEPAPVAPEEAVNEEASQEQATPEQSAENEAVIEHATQAVIASQTGELDEEEEVQDPDEAYSETGKALSKDEEIANAIEQAIQDRLKTLETDTEEEEEIDEVDSPIQH